MPFVVAENHGPIEIYYEEWGAGSPVVLIGGLSSTVEVWGKQAPALARQHRVIAPDNRGSGRTRLSEDDGVRTPERFAGDVLALLDGLRLERAHLLGASLGGMIVQEFALAHPGRLLSLVIACSNCGGEEAIAAPPEVLEALMAGSGGNASDEQKRAAFAVAFHPRSFEERVAAIEFYAATKEAQPHPPEEIERRRQGLASFSTWDRLPSLSVPTLVITGAQDALIPPENSRLLAERISDAELVLIENGGHVFFIEQPEATNRALLDFFGRHDPGS